MRKLLALIGIATALVAGASSSASAGGWVAVSLDGLPAVHPDEDVEIGFTVLRHGVTPETNNDLEVVVTGNGEQYRFPASPDGAVGHHVATIRIDELGSYHWSVTSASGFVTAELGTLDVTKAPSGPSWTWDAVQWGSGALALAMAVLAALDYRRARRDRATTAPAAV